VPADTSSYQDAGLDPVSEYCYRVRAINIGSQSAFTNVDCGTTLAGPIFTAYNDCVYDVTLDGTDTDPNGQAVHYLAPNVTTFGIGAGFAGSTTGGLLDQPTGNSTGVTVTLTESGGVNWQPAVGPTWDGGYDTALGTDARNTFGGIADMTGVIYYGSLGWWVEVTFTGLDPGRVYTFATSSSRAKQNTDGAPGYDDRWTIFTVSGVDGATNESSLGTTEYDDGSGPDPWRVWFNTGNNHNDGYLARWTDIEPGADGSFTVRAEAHPNSASGGLQAYAFDLFLLQEFAPCDPPQIVTQPQSQWLCQGDDALFTVGAMGTGTLHYQWLKEGSPVGTDTDTLILAEVQPADDGAAIMCEVTDQCSIPVTSSSATLTVTPETPGDVNGDGFIDGRDIPGFLDVLFNNPTGPLTPMFCAADLDDSGVVDQGDVGLFAAVLVAN
jgi:hypothetical protein